MAYDIRTIYNWEIELINGTVINDGNKFNFDEVIRCSFVPNLKLLPRHDIIFTDFKFKKRFARAFMGWNSIIREYLHCVMTDKFRVYIKSTNGSCIITPKDYELRL